MQEWKLYKTWIPCVTLIDALKNDRFNKTVYGTAESFPFPLNLIFSYRDAVFLSCLCS